MGTLYRRGRDRALPCVVDAAPVRSVNHGAALIHIRKSSVHLPEAPAGVRYRRHESVTIIQADS